MLPIKGPVAAFDRVFLNVTTTDKFFHLCSSKTGQPVLSPLKLPIVTVFLELKDYIYNSIDFACTTYKLEWASHSFIEQTGLY